jgi:hypothetical protein
MYGDVADEIVELSNQLTESIENSDDIEFAIPLNVKLVFAKDDSEGAQIVLTKAEDGISGLKKALVLEKSVSADKSHPYLQSDAIKEINERLKSKFQEGKLRNCLHATDKAGKPTINANCFQSLIHKLKWKNGNNQYHHFITKPSAHLYSDLSLNEIIKKITSNDEYLRNAKKSYNKK